MQSSVPSYLLTGFLLLSGACACKFKERDGQIQVALDALTFPVTDGKDPKLECASTAAAFGMVNAALKPSGDGSPPMCVIFEEDDECLSFEPMTGAIALTDIKGCKAASLTAITDQAVDLKGAAGEDVTVGGTSAKALEGVAAVGEAAASDLTMASAEECLATCALWIPDCTHVTVDAQKPGAPAHCSFHASPTNGYTMKGPTTYYAIKPGPEMMGRNLGALTGNKEVPDLPEEPAAAPMDEAGAPMDEAGAGPLAEGPVATGGAYDAIFGIPHNGECPRKPVEDVPAGKHGDSLNVPGSAVDEYGDMLNDGKLDMPYDEIQTGDSYCVKPGSGQASILIGGTFHFETKDGGCAPPPTNAAGEPCCEIFMWQPNNGGYYYDNCSMKWMLKPDGLFYFTTEMPGDESVVGWGADPEPHIHYDVMCDGCSAETAGDIFDGEYRYFNKFYPEGICQLAACGPVKAEIHASEKLGPIDGMEAYLYHWVMPQNNKA